MTTQELSQVQKDIVVGTLLGDGNLQTGSRGKTWRYRALQSKAQVDYLTVKYEALKEFCTTGILEQEFQDKRIKTTTKRVYFNTTVHRCFNPYANLFYTFDKETGRFVKDVPDNIGKLLTPRAVAFLYQDDGALKDGYKTKAMRICTEYFSKEGVQRLSDAMKSNFSIETSLAPKYKYRDKIRSIVGYRIYIPARSGPAFCDLIREFMVDSLKYKLTC